MKRQVCDKCVAFDVFREQCALGNIVVKEMEKTYIAEFDKDVNFLNSILLQNVISQKLRRTFIILSAILITKETLSFF